MRALLRDGADPNEGHPIDGVTALHHAACASDPVIFALLMSHGADSLRRSVRSWVSSNDELWPRACTPIDVLDVQLHRDLRRGHLTAPRIAEEWASMACVLDRSLSEWCDALQAPRALSGTWTAVLIAEPPSRDWGEPGADLLELREGGAPCLLHLGGDGRCALDDPDGAASIRGEWQACGDGALIELACGDGALLELAREPGLLVVAEPLGRFLELEFDRRRWVLAPSVQ